MFFRYRIYETTAEGLTLSKATELSLAERTYRDYMENALRSACGTGTPVERIEWHMGLTAAIRRRIGDAYLPSEEGYAILIPSFLPIFTIRLFVMTSNRSKSF